MKKTFLVKKNPNMPCTEDNWITMNSHEFAIFLKTEEGQMRKNNFAKIPPVDMSDTYIVMECDIEKAKKLDRESKVICRKQNQKRTSGYMELYFDELSTDVDIEELIEFEDKTVNIESEVIRNDEIKRLKEALDSLSEDEIELIGALFLSEPPVSMKRYAKYKNTSLREIRYRKEVILKKLKVWIENAEESSNKFRKQFITIHSLT